MSSIKLKHSGGNGVSIAAPSSNPASDKTITLPNDESGQIITSDRSGTTLQRQFKYLTSNTQLAKGGAIGELNSDLRIDFTPKAADSNLLMEFLHLLFFQTQQIYNIVFFMTILLVLVSVYRQQQVQELDVTGQTETVQ